MTLPGNPHSERILILAPLGRDASLAASLLQEADYRTVICKDVEELQRGLADIAGMALITEEAVRTVDLSGISRWVRDQPTWSDIPFIVLTARGGGIERNPDASRLLQVFGNASFLERPFHPTTLISSVQTALRGRRRQYEARARLEELRIGETKLKVALAAEKVATDHQRLLIDELNHRVKNTLATVQSIAMQTLRNTETMDAAYTAMETRLLALSRAHDVLTRENWDGANISEVVAHAIAPYRDHDNRRFRLSGPEIRLNPRMSLAIAMAMQELATNAVKYGALSNETGIVAIEWTRSTYPKDGRLDFSWRESGGPPVVAPTRRGFGSRLIERSLARDLDGSVSIAFETSGIVCTIAAPLS